MLSEEEKQEEKQAEELIKVKQNEKSWKEFIAFILGVIIFGIIEITLNPFMLIIILYLLN